MAVYINTLIGGDITVGSGGSTPKTWTWPAKDNNNQVNYAESLAWIQSNGDGQLGYYVPVTEPYYDTESNKWKASIEIYNAQPTGPDQYSWSSMWGVCQLEGNENQPDASTLTLTDTEHGQSYTLV